MFSLFSLKPGFTLVYTRFHLCENFVSWNNLQACLGYTKLLAFCYRTKYVFNSLSECPTNSSYHLSQALPISSSITHPLLSLPCKGTRTPLRTLTLFSPYSLKMFIWLVQATAHTSVPNMSAHMKVTCGRPRTGSLGPTGSHSLTQNTLLWAKFWLSSHCPFSFLQVDLSPEAHLLKSLLCNYMQLWMPNALWEIGFECTQLKIKGLNGQKTEKWEQGDGYHGW